MYIKVLQWFIKMTKCFVTSEILSKYHASYIL